MEKNEYIKTSGEGLWFTSDTHFGHTNVIRFCDRPFKDADEMNECLIRNWNEMVKENDIVYHLGDFAFAGSGMVKEILNQLNGTIYLIKGNHDEKFFRNYEHYDKIKWIGYQMHMRIENQWIYLNHYPFLCYGGAYRNEAVWQLFGHVHSTPEKKEGLDKSRLQYLFPYQYDVGVDNNNYRPVSFYEIKEIINAQAEKAREIKETEEQI